MAVMCEVLNPDGTPHESNGRALIDDDDDDFWFYFEQDTLIDPETNLPLDSPKNGYPGPQGPYYTSVGANNTKGRDLVDEHLHLCLEVKLNVEGINTSDDGAVGIIKFSQKVLLQREIKFG